MLSWMTFETRFRSLKCASYSTGTLLLTIDNLSRSIRFLRDNTFLLLVIPGPTELNTDQLNGLLEPFVQVLEQLGQGKLPYLRFIVMHPSLMILHSR